MRVINTRDEATTMSLDEVRIINNALNEVCNAFDLRSFAARIGVERESSRRSTR